MNDSWTRYDFGAPLPDLGLYHLTVSEAAELIAIDLWVDGEIDVAEELADDADLLTTDPRLKVALSETINLFKDRLSRAIDSGSLKCDYVRRDFDEKLLVENTVLSISDLKDWLSDRGHMTSVAFEEWEELQGEIYMGLLFEVDALRAIGKGGHRAVRGYVHEKSHFTNNQDEEKADPKDVILWLQHSLAENARLKAKLAEAEKQQTERATRPLMTRERDTLLTIIGILCEEAGIDPKRSAKAASAIQSAADKMGIAIGETTIENHLKKVQEAIAPRMR